MSFNLGFIGGGNMSTAIVKGILKKEAHPSSKIWVSGPHLENLQTWKDLGTHVTTMNGEVFSKCDIIFLGVKPHLLQRAVKECKDMIDPTTACKAVLFVSMLAGITIEGLNKELKTLSVNARVIRIMPNTPMTVGAGACLITPDSDVSEKECQTVVELLSSGGVCERIPESMMGSLGALTGCGPAFMYIIIEALADGAVKQGAPRAAALRLAAQMVLGSGQMVLSSNKHPGLLKDEVCSPGGSTICGVAALEEGKIRATLIKAIDAATQRTKEMGKQ